MKVHTVIDDGRAVILRDDSEVGFASLITENGAMFSVDEKYRYLLWRVWDCSRPFLGWVLLNPSTADHEQSDATMDRCNTRARAYGYGGQITANIFAVRSRDPKILATHPDPKGPLNDLAILLCARATRRVVCGWGGHGKLYGRGEKVLKLLRDNAFTPYCLDMGMNGQPKHPIYLPFSLFPREMK